MYEIILYPFLLLTLFCEYSASERRHRSSHNISTHRIIMSSVTQGQEEDNTSSDTFALSDESKLINFLQRRYNLAGTLPRPVRNSSDAITIAFGIALIQILDFDETNQVLTTNIWKRYRWKDELLMWDPQKFGGIKDIRIHARDIWVPDIVLYNKADNHDNGQYKPPFQKRLYSNNNADDQDKNHDEMVAVYHDGWVRWIPPAIYKSSCAIDMRNFPFDTQTCHFKFGSWMYDGYKLSLSFYGELEDIDLRNYIKSSEFDLINTTAEHHIKYYPCCGDEPYPDITYYLTIQRRPAFHIYILVLPSILLSFLTLVLFWIPPQRPDRTSLGMSLFSSFFVLLLILVQSAPPTSASISLLGVFYCINMVLVAFSTMLSAVVINLTHYLQSRHIPRTVKLIFVDVLGRLLCAQCADTMAHERERDTDINVNSLLPERKYGNRAGVNNYATPPLIDSSQAARTREWKILAAVIDRIFFILYVTGISLSIIFVFPR